MFRDVRDYSSSNPGEQQREKIRRTLLLQKLRSSDFSVDKKKAYVSFTSKVNVSLFVAGLVN